MSDDGLPGDEGPELTPGTVAPAPAPPTLADRVAAIDAVEVASRIIARGTRAAIGASAIEIIAMAHRLIHLTTLADLTFDMLQSADTAQDETLPEQKRRLRAAVRLKVGDVGAALEELGYGQPETTINQTENHDGTRQD
jgi:hypothetical protein